MRHCHKTLTNADITAYVKDQVRACRRPNGQPVGPKPAEDAEDDHVVDPSTSHAATHVSLRVMSLDLSQTRSTCHIVALQFIALFMDVCKRSSNVESSNRACVV